MTVEAYTPNPVQVISGVGPYPVQHPYTTGSLRVSVALGGSFVDLDAADFTVVPASGDAGAVTLTAAAATLYDGGSLYVQRLTSPEQGWTGLSSREDGLEAQLDWLTQATQDLLARQPRTLQAPLLDQANLQLPAAAERAGKVLAFSVPEGAPVPANLLSSSFLVTDWAEAFCQSASALAARSVLGLTPAAITSFSANVDFSQDPDRLATRDVTRQAVSQQIQAEVSSFTSGGLYVIGVNDPAVEFVGIPDSAVALLVSFAFVATRANSGGLVVQLGDAASDFDHTYLGGMTLGGVNYSNSFGFRMGVDAGASVNGHMQLTKIRDHLWVASSQGSIGSQSFSMGGRVEMPGPVAALRVADANGSGNLFPGGGEISMQWR